MKEIALNPEQLKNKVTIPFTTETIYWEEKDDSIIIAFPGTGPEIRSWLFDFWFKKILGYHVGFYTKALSTLGYVIEAINNSTK